MTNKQYKILKYIRTHNNTQTVCNKFNVDYQELQKILPKNSLIFNPDCSEVYLTDWIESDVESRHREDCRYAIPIIISIISFVGAYRQELAQIIQVIMKLLKQ